VTICHDFTSFFTNRSKSTNNQLELRASEFVIFDLPIYKAIRTLTCSNRSSLGLAGLDTYKIKIIHSNQNKGAYHMQPEKYLHPERFQWYLIKTDKGFKRTFAKSQEQAINQAIKKGYKVYSTQAILIF